MSTTSRPGTGCEPGRELRDSAPPRGCAVRFTAERGTAFLSCYRFAMLDAAWSKLGWVIAATGMLGCRPPGETPPAEASTRTETAVAAEPQQMAAKTSASEAGAWVDAIDRAVARGIVPSGADDGSYRVDAFVAVLLFELLHETRGEPVFTPVEPADDEVGTAGGFVVGPLDERSIVHRLGLREGDIVQSINGVALSSPDPFPRALDGAQNRVSLTLVRDGFSMTMSYRLIEAHTWTDLLADFVGSGADAGEPLDASTSPPPASETDAPPAPSPVPSDPTKATPAPASTPKPSSGARPSSPTTPRPKLARCESASKCTVDKAHFDELVAAPHRLQSQVDIVPAIRNDVHSGYKLATVRPGTTVADLGFRSGDKITHVNGYDLTNDAQAMQLYLALAGSRLFNVRYERGTRKLVKTIVVR